MRHFFSTIHMVTNAAGTERVAVGMLIVDNEGPWVGLSKSKLAIVARLLGDDDAYISASSLLKGLEKEAQRTGTEGFVDREMFSSAYLRYLNTYDKGLVSFSEPSPLTSDWTPKLRKAFFSHFVGLLDSPKRTGALSALVKAKLAHPVVRERADINYKLTPALLQSIYRNHVIPFISRNGHITVGGLVDFNAEEITVERKFAEYRAIYAGLTLYSKSEKLGEPEMTIYVNEPVSSGGRKLRDLVNKDSTARYDLVSPDELDNLPNILENSDSKPFSSFVVSA